MSKPQYITCLFKKANVPDANGRVYTEESLKNMADNKTLFWDEENKQLNMKTKLTVSQTKLFMEMNKNMTSLVNNQKDIPDEFSAIVDKYFWDLI